MDQLSQRGEALHCVKAGLTGISGAATTFSTGAAALMYSVAGKAATKAQVSGGATPTTDGVTGAAITLAINFGMVVVWAIDLAGNIKVVAGQTVPLDTQGNLLLAPQWPAIPDTLAPFAYHLMKNGSTGSLFTFGVTNWNSTGMTHVVQDVLVLPDRPQTS